MALTGALCQTLLAATGFTNKSLRVLIAGLLGSDYRANQMTYDLRWLRLAGQRRCKGLRAASGGRAARRGEQRAPPRQRSPDAARRVGASVDHSLRRRL
jgi:hypothetical protein